MATTEAGHHPNRVYIDQDGDLHLNGANLRTDEAGAVLSPTELGFVDGVTPGTVAASKAVVVDANKDAASFRDITLRSATLTGNLSLSATNAITAFATGGQASATALTTDFNRITV